MTRTGFYWDERCFWHYGAGYALTAEVGGLVQPFVSGGLPEEPETKRRLVNLMRVTGLFDELHASSAPSASDEDLRRVHPKSYLDAFQTASDAGGGELIRGNRAPFGQGGFEIAKLSAGLIKQATAAVLSGEVSNAYALCRPPGHHCLPEEANGFCLLANIAIAIEAAKVTAPDLRVAVVDWDVHHGNGTEAIFYDRSDVLTVSIHQDRNYPTTSGHVGAHGAGAGEGCNVNIPLPPGAGHDTYVEAMDRIVLPKVRAFSPDIIIVASGFDASGVDPLSRMLCSADTFGAMTRQIMDLANLVCEGRVAMAHEGGYSELHVPFCGHAVLAEMSGSKISAEDPLGARLQERQPSSDVVAFYSGLLAQIATQHGVE